MFKMRFALRIALPLAAPFLLCASGCHAVRAINNRQCHDVQPYMSATSVPLLKIPSGLDAPDATNALRLPALNEPEPRRRGSKEPCLDEPPPYKVQQPARPPQA
jgi:uncharacterized lipoprotein